MAEEIFNIDITPEIIEELRELVKNNAPQIQRYRDTIQEHINTLITNNMLSKTRKQNKTRWRNFITQNYIINISEVKQKKLDEELIKCLFQAYQDIEEILHNLKLIRQVSFSLTSIEPSGDGTYNYIRLSNTKLTSDSFYLDQASSKNGATLAIRLKQESLKEQIKQAKVEDDFEKINAHFQLFIEPFVNYQKAATTTTQWRINKGVLAETFERHWQNQGHKNQNPLILNNSDIQSIGQRWWMYRLSSGSDPFFTGPDTIYSQVKNINAALVSNVNTIISALYGLLGILNPENIKNISETTLKKIFAQAPVKNSINYDIARAIEDAGENVAEEFKKKVKEQCESDDIKITYTKKQKEKIASLNREFKYLTS